MIDRSRLPALGPEPFFRFPRATRHMLDNGLAVWTAEHRGLPVAVFALLVPGGAAADPVSHPGLAALTGDMLDEGAGARDAIEIQAALARLGAVVETEVGSDATLVVLTSLTRFAREALAIVADIVVRPRFDRRDFDRVRDLRLNRLVQLRDLPPSLADRAFLEALYGSHGYGHLPLGTEAGLRAAAAEDVTSLHRRVFRPASATCIAVGDVSHEDLSGFVRQAFGDWEGAAGEGDRLLVPPSPDLVAAAGRARRLVVLHRPGTSQSELRVGHLGVPRQTADYHALLVLNAVLGGQFTSRLNLRLREEKGYTYGARSAFDFRREPGPFVVQVAVATDVTGEAIADTIDEIESIRASRPVTPEELDLARASLTRGYPRSFETADQVARAFAQMALHDLPEDHFERFVPAIVAVDGEEVTRVAAAHLHPARLLTTVVGDWDAAGVAIGRLDVGEPVLIAPSGPTAGPAA